MRSATASLNTGVVVTVIARAAGLADVDVVEADAHGADRARGSGASASTAASTVAWEFTSRPRASASARRSSRGRAGEVDDREVPIGEPLEVRRAEA